MAGPDRETTDPLDRSAGLARDPHRYGFYQALRLIECAHPDRPRLGRGVKAADDPVFLGQEPSLAFAPSALAAYEDGEDRPRLDVFFFGLFGANGPLPIHLTEYARDRMRNEEDRTFARFADIFHHRMLSLFYRSWGDAQPAVNFDRPAEDRFARYLGALGGIGTPELRDRDALPDLTRFHFAAHLGNASRHPEGLEKMLRAFFDVPVRIREFIGSWTGIPEGDRCRLGGPPETSALGSTALIGSRVWGCQGKFRVVFGPLGYEDYERLLPGSDSLDRLIALVKGYVGDEFVWDVNVILKKNEVPPLRLGRNGRLGWTGWLVSRPPERDADGLLLNPLARAGRGESTEAAPRPSPLGATA